MSKRRSRRPSRGALPAAIERARERIEHWRATRDKRTHMPKALWRAAAAVGQDHGLWAVSQALRVNYESLKKRVEQMSPSELPAAAGFVELDAAQLVSRPGQTAMTVIELMSEDGAKLTVRLEGQEAPDVSALARAFWERDR